MTEKQKDMVDYFVICTGEFAKRHRLGQKEALMYLLQYKGLEHLEESFDVEHTFSFEDMVDHMEMICRNNGGTI